MYVCMYVCNMYVWLYVYTHTHAHTYVYTLFIDTTYGRKTYNNRNIDIQIQI